MNWSKLRGALFFLVLFCLSVKAQTDILFDQNNLASVRILVSSDTVNWIYNNVNSDRYFRATLVYENGSIKDTIRQVGFRLRGNTSRHARKKSFKLSFNTFQSGRRYRGVKKMNLVGHHNDPTMVRQKLYYDIWNKLGLPMRRTSFVKVFINSDYYGLYTSLEEMDNDWLTRVYGVNSGNLYKCVYPADLVYLGSNQQTYKNLMNGTVSGGRVYELETNENVDDYSGFVKLLQNIHQATGNNAAQLLNEVLNVDLFIKAMALDVATGHWDNYGYNKNNFYLYHNPFTDKFDFISYDTDNTFGVDWVNVDWAKRSVENWIHPNEPRPLASRVLDVPPFKQRYFQYLDSISRYVLHPFYIYSSIDAMQAFIRPAAIDDTWRTLDYGYDIEAFDRGFSGTVDGHTPYGIKPFLAQRASSTIRELMIPLRLESKLPELPQIQVFASQNRVHISGLAQNTKVTFILMDGTGKRVIDKPVATSILDLPVLSTGIYFYQLVGPKSTFSGKLILLN